jgi:hypothetical protein
MEMVMITLSVDVGCRREQRRAGHVRLAQASRDLHQGKPCSSRGASPSPVSLQRSDTIGRILSFDPACPVPRKIISAQRQMPDARGFILCG